MKNLESILKVSAATGMSVEYVCESVEENKLEDLVKTLEFHKAEAKKIEETIEKFIKNNEKIEKEQEPEKSDEEILADIDITPESHPEVFGAEKHSILASNVDPSFGEENLESGRKLLADILGEE